MSEIVSPNPIAYWRSRYGLAAFWFLYLLLGWFILRTIFYVSFGPSGLPPGVIVSAFLRGFYRDAFVALIATIPMLCWFWLVPNNHFNKQWHRILFLMAFFITCFAQTFGLFTEYFFFEEFKSRYNTVAVDYLVYPQEVFVNIWQSYHVTAVVLVCLFVSIALLLIVSRVFRGMWERPFTAKSRFFCLVLVCATVAILTPTMHLRPAPVSSDRTLNEIANNGSLAFISACLTRHLDYSAFYKTLPLDEAYLRVRRIIAQSNSAYAETGHSIRRKIDGDPTRPRLNVVVMLEESLGSEFWGSLGAAKSWTPEMDKLATTEALFFTNLYANGNRTVRGMEGVLSSFPSLPGDSIVKRDLSDNVETIARTLKRDGYSTIFLYGGRGLFDGMRSFAIRNGYDRFIEQKHFTKPTHTTAWGVCDEDIFDRTIEELRELNKTGQPFFATTLSVSNHKPYTYPKGRIPEDPGKKSQLYGVKYSDYALGHFFEAAKKESFWTNTIFVVVADHGARVYGKQSIPIHSYEIPLVILGPAVVKSPARLGQLGCSLDVAPTVLGLLGRPYESLFFGRDLLRLRPEEGRVFLNHNRDIGMLHDDRLVVLGLNKTGEFYTGDPKRVDMTTLEHPTDADQELENDTIAIYQVADDLYTHQRYHLDPR